MLNVGGIKQASNCVQYVPLILKVHILYSHIYLQMQSLPKMFLHIYKDVCLIISFPLLFSLLLLCSQYSMVFIMIAVLNIT